MREIKFRVWDKEDKRMITHTQDFIPLIVTNFGVMKLNPTQEQHNYYFPEQVDRFELMEYTGLKDRHGVEIYEGDIVKNEMGDTGEVKYGAFNCSCCEGIYGWHFTDPVDIRDYEACEVIGNIYENPELLR